MAFRIRGGPALLGFTVYSMPSFVVVLNIMFFLLVKWILRRAMKGWWSQRHSEPTPALEHQQVKPVMSPFMFINCHVLLSLRTGSWLRRETLTDAGCVE